MLKVAPGTFNRVNHVAIYSVYLLCANWKEYCPSILQNKAYLQLRAYSFFYFDIHNYQMWGIVRLFQGNERHDVFFLGFGLCMLFTNDIILKYMLLNLNSLFKFEKPSLAAVLWKYADRISSLILRDWKISSKLRYFNWVL